MENEVSVIDILNRAKECFREVRQNYVTGAAYLHKIKTERLYEGHFESFSAFLDDCGISDGQASKLIAAFEFYCIRAGYEPARIAGIDYEKLYLSTKVEGTPDKKLAFAETLTRQELRDTISEAKAGPHEHEWVEIRFCKKCNAREKIYGSKEGK